MKSPHTVQFFDSRDSLGADVAAFLRDGLDAGERIMLLARPLHVEAIGEALAGEGHRLESLARDGRLLLVDLRTTLRDLMSNGRPNPAAFETLLAAPVRQATARGPVRAYGELVDLLAVDDNLRASAEVEGLWAALIEALPLRMHCGYTSATFAAGTDSGRAMKTVCAQHDHVSRNGHDLLANWLLAQHVDQPAPAPAAPRARS